MAKLSLKAGTTSYTANIFVQDSSSTSGAGKTGLAYNTASLTAYYVRPKSSAVAITLATQTVTGSFSSGGFVEIDGTNMPGVYRLDLPDAALASGVGSVAVLLKGATNMAPVVLEMELTGWDSQDAVRGGLTALPNVNAGNTNGLPLSADGSGRVDVLKVNGTTQTARDLGANIDATISSRSTYAGADTSGTTTLLSRIAAAITITSGKVDVNDKTGFSLSGAGVQAIWDALTSALTTVGSIGKRIADNVDSVLSAIQADTNDIQTRLPASLVSGRMDSSVGAMAANTLTASALATDARDEIVDQVWDEAISGHLTGGTTGAALNGAGAAGDPWGTTLPGAYAAGTAGKIVGDNLNATIASRLASASYVTPLDSAGVRGAVGLTSANLDTQLGALPTSTQVADAILKRDWTAVTGEAARSMLNALRVLRNKVSVSSGVMTVMKEDDSTSAFTAIVTTDAAADPIVSIDPS